jgi:class 3 adenylate cyclase/pimeloyl-ACP methyl ester carboxylesterase
VQAPRTRYALTREGVCIAYQVVGEGVHDLVFSPGWVTNIEILWEFPASAALFSRLARRCRVAVYDKQGTGLSDRVATLPDLEARMDDITAVMDAAGMERAALFGPTQGAAVSALFAASHPDRTSAFIAYGGFARATWAPDWPFEDQESADWEDHLTTAEWGTESWARRFAFSWGGESLVGDPAFLRWLAKLMRFSATPTAAAAFNDAFNETDVRDILPTIAVPTLLLHRANQDDGPQLEATAAMIPLARVQELPPDHWSPYLGDPEPMASAIESFLDGIHEQEVGFDRVLATLLFTDIVDSTAHAARLGDRAWRDVVERHHTIVRALLARYRGVEIDTAGDGFFATFDGPARAVRCAQACAEAVRTLGIEIRAGVHTGEVEAVDNKAGGIAVATCSRIASLAGPSEVFVSSTVKDLVAGSGLAFEDRGEHELKGVPDRWRLYRVVA